MQLRVRLATLALSAAALPLVTACGGAGPKDAAARFLTSWTHGDLSAAAETTDDPTSAMRALSDFAKTLHVSGLKTRLGVVSTHGDSADAEYTADVTVRGAGAWHYTAHLQLARTHSHWQVHWTTTDLHPQYAAGTRLALERTLPPRAPMFDRRGRALFTPQEVVNIGLEPQRLGSHAAGTIAAVARTLGVDAGGLTKAVAAAQPTQFVPVITLRRAAYDKVKPRIYSLPGTVFVTDTALLPPTTGFARALLGTVGPATADVLKAAGPAYAAGDVLGLSGLQEVFQRRLAGTATTSVVVRAASGQLVDTLKTFTGTPGSSVRTTLDIDVQKAAESALAHESRPAALVAVDAHTGAVLAVANTPDATSFDRALVGHYPPGSTFKLVTAYALLGAGVAPATPIPCPRQITVEGKVFTNFEGESGGAPTFADDFARSCNTAFIGAGRKLSAGALPAAATALGVGGRWQLPIDAFSGSIPSPSSAVEQAADSIGQGRVEASPLGLALIAAAIADGTPRPPTLVTDPAQTPARPFAPLDAGRLASLRAMMHRVVTSGTAAGAHLPSGTYGKTGTAEFGSDSPPKTHAWFVGYRGDVAFAVLVEGGGVGGQVAAPIAATFLRDLG